MLGSQGEREREREGEHVQILPHSLLPPSFSIISSPLHPLSLLSLPNSFPFSLFPSFLLFPYCFPCFFFLISFSQLSILLPSLFLYPYSCYSFFPLPPSLFSPSFLCSFPPLSLSCIPSSSLLPFIPYISFLFSLLLFYSHLPSSPAFLPYSLYTSPLLRVLSSPIVSVNLSILLIILLFPACLPPSLTLSLPHFGTGCLALRVDLTS